MMKQPLIPAMMAVHQTGNRLIPYASAMLPVRRDFVFCPVSRDLLVDAGQKGTTVGSLMDSASSCCMITEHSALLRHR
jgi:hypothetical protein